MRRRKREGKGEEEEEGGIGGIGGGGGGGGGRHGMARGGGGGGRHGRERGRGGGGWGGGGGAVLYLEELKGSALFQFLEHGPEVAPAAPRLFNIRLIIYPPKQHPWGVGKVCLEWKQLLHPFTHLLLQTVLAISGKPLTCCQAGFLQ